MQFVNCDFGDGAPQISFATFEGCTFLVTDLNQLPGAWQCINCTVIYGDETFSYGQSRN